MAVLHGTGIAYVCIIHIRMSCVVAEVAFPPSLHTSGPTSGPPAEAAAIARGRPCRRNRPCLPSSPCRPLRPFLAPPPRRRLHPLRLPPLPLPPPRLPPPASRPPPPPGL